MTEKERNRKKQQDRRNRLRARGGKLEQVYLEAGDHDLLKMCYEAANDPGNSFESFKRTALIRGAVFVANTGKGKRIKKIDGRYIVTEEMK